MFKKLKYGIANLIKWFPVIWKDRDWDHYFFHKMMQQKLIHIEKFFREHGNHIRSEADAKDVKFCINLLERILEDEYEEKAFAPHDKKWGKVSMDVGKNGLVSFNRDKVLTEEEKEQERKEFQLCNGRAYKSRMNDLEYLYNYIAKHVTSWWD